MRCDEVKELLLTADPGALEEGSDEGLAAHLDRCPSCHGQWQAVQESLGRLASGLTALEGPAQAGLGRPRRPQVRPHLKRPAWGRSTTAGLLALAAGLAGVLWLGRDEGVPAPFDPSVGVELGLTSPLIRTDSHDDVAVLPTNNPDIAVIWFF